MSRVGDVGPEIALPSSKAASMRDHSYPEIADVGSQLNLLLAFSLLPVGSQASA